MATLSEFSPYENYVQGGMTDGRFMNAAYTVLAAGPPRLSNVGGADLLGASERAVSHKPGAPLSSWWLNV